MSVSSGTMRAPAKHGRGRGGEPRLGTRVRVRYAKTGRLRFISAIDLGRVWERSLRKAELPIAYSEGYSPHPKVSFPDALGLGYASTGEYAELAFAAPVAVDAAVDALNDAFPDGLAVLAAAPAVEGTPKLSKWLNASLWHLDYGHEVDAAALARAAEAVMAAEQVPVQRERKGERTELDLRPALFELSAAGRRVHVVVHHVQPPARPTEVHQALGTFYRPNTPEGALPEPTLATRVAQGSPEQGGLREALTGVHVPLKGPPPE